MADGQQTGALGIVVGGGPAPGINAVIAAATIRTRLSGTRVVGIQNGFERLMQADAHDAEAFRELDIRDVSRIHFRGGSMLGTSRANPTRRDELLDRVLSNLRSAGIDKLVTIGGDDTSFSCSRLASRSNGALSVAHVPKTIDNDLDLPPSIDTFGYQTARAVRVEVVQNLMVDAKTTNRWYLVIAMGRKAGHLALGIGKAAGATLTVVPEECETSGMSLDRLADTLAGSIIKRRSEGRGDGVAVVAEGVALAFDPKELEALENVERDEHGHIRLAEVDLGSLLKDAVHERLQALGIDCTLVSKNIGYELRCADPVPSDMEYCRDLGYCAGKYLLEGGSGDLISLQGGRFIPIPLDELIDSTTGRMQVRMIDVSSTRYAISRSYMIRLRRSDFSDTQTLARLASTAGVSSDEFRERFAYLVDDEPPPLVLR
ncbi:MAG: 6-phosphofructokinase [Phycisphaerae bacterium]|nr:6-phosphofructokinase [Phycisphaerae bacterium]